MRVNPGTGTGLLIGTRRPAARNPVGPSQIIAVRYFALNGTDHRTHAEQDTAIGDYIRWRNHRAQPKSGFAINSKIRHPDYPFKAA